MSVCAATFVVPFTITQHSLLALYSFGASAQQLQAISDAEREKLEPINLPNGESQGVDEHVIVTPENWSEYVGPEK